MDHSAVTTFFKIKRAYNTSSPYIDLNTHFMEIMALKNKESITIACTLNQVWLCCYPAQLIVYMTIIQNLSPPNFKNFVNHMEFNQIDHCQKPSSQQHP
jgi:hypothetical protein